jgi:hypothetical protein
MTLQCSLKQWKLDIISGVFPKPVDKAAKTSELTNFNVQKFHISSTGIINIVTDFLKASLWRQKTVLVLGNQAIAQQWKTVSMASVDSSFLGNRKVNKLLQQYRDCYNTSSQWVFYLGPCVGDISRPTKLNSVSLLVAVSSGHCVCETPLKAVLYLESVNWLCVIVMTIL